MARHRDSSRRQILRFVVALCVLLGLLVTWPFGAAVPAHADDPEQQQPSAPPNQGWLGEVEYHQAREDPDARLQIVFRSAKILNDHDWGLGEFRFLLWFWRVNAGCSPDAISEECNTTMLRHKSVQLSAHDGQTLIFDQLLPDAGPGTQVLEPSIGPDIGIPVWSDSTYGMAIAGIETDAVINDELGALEVVISVANNWRIGTWTERGRKRESGSDCSWVPFGCAFRLNEADTIVTYEVRLAPLPDLVPAKIEKVALTGTMNDGVCIDVINAGTLDAGPFQVVLRIDDTPAPNGTLQAGGLPAQRVGTFCTETTLPTSGQHRLSVTVDEARAVLEQRETNNRGEQTLDLTQTGSTRPQGGPGGPGPVVIDAGTGSGGAGPSPTPSPSATPTPSQARPDLAVSAIRIQGREPDGKDDCKDGRNNFTVVVKNGGAASAGAFLVQLRVDGESDQAPDKSVPGLEAGQEREVRFDGIRLKKGEHKLEAIADAQKTVAESDEGNNTRIVAARCKDDD